MLVLFKANTLVAIESPDDLAPSGDDLLLEAEDEVRRGRRLPLEQQLHRRPTALPPQKRRVTLQELIDQLQVMATALQLQSEAIATNTRKSHFRSHSRAQALQALELAHQENLTEVARELEQVLNRYSHRILEQEAWLDLEQLVFWVHTTKSSEMSTEKSNADASSRAQHNEATRTHAHQPHDRVSVFWALLLLSAQSKVELSQEDFYQEIKIRTLRDLPLSDHDHSQEPTGVLFDSAD
jgi:segregation and condensation protein A